MEDGSVNRRIIKSIVKKWIVGVSTGLFWCMLRA